MKKSIIFMVLCSVQFVPVTFVKIVFYYVRCVSIYYAKTVVSAQNAKKTFAKGVEVLVRLVIKNVATLV